MPSFDIVKKSETSSSFRCRSVIDQFDLNKYEEEVREEFSGEIKAEKDGCWNIGVIYGNSGTGKSTIANKLYSDYIFKGINSDKRKPTVEIMPQDAEIKEISKTFNSVGFSSPPSWIKPYNVLSTGEKMRVNLAYCMLKSDDLFVFDEYTSTVNRDVAKIGSCAIQKAVRRRGKKFIAVSCHTDVLDWLEPDWTFCTDDMTYREYSGDRHRRPEIKIEIKKERGKWDMFRKYHYLSHTICPTSHQYVGYYNNRPMCFCSVLHHPSQGKTSIKRISRLVVLPDYQGVGIGRKLLTKISEKYFSYGNRVRIITSNPALLHSLKNHEKWYLTEKKRQKTEHTGAERFKSGGWSSGKRTTYHWEFYDEALKKEKGETTMGDEV
jgi:ABC-type lipoprotein export system ATPase subunit/predicted acetyltransferase